MRKVWIGAALAAALTMPAGAMGPGSYGNNPSHDSFRPPAGASDDYQEALKLLNEHKYADAIPHLLIALVNKPDDADIMNYLGFTYRMTGDYQSSLRFYQKALAAKPDHRGAHEYLGELYLDLKDPASAQKELDTLASLCPGGCIEHDTLAKAIAAYQANGATPNPAPTW